MALLTAPLTAAAEGLAEQGNPDPAVFERALESARQDASVPFGLVVSCRDEARFRAARVYPGGAGAWGNAVQIRVDRSIRDGLIADLLSAGFPRFEPRYGGQDKPAQAEAAMRILCQIRATAGDVEKYSVQAAYGEQSAAFARLAAALLDRLEPLAADGIGADDLGQALAMLARGALAPELLTVRLVRLPPGGGAAEAGVIVRLEGLRSSRQSYRPGRSNAASQSAAASPETVQRIAGAAVAAGFASLPVNLPGTGYTELEVEVLAHAKTVIARDFTRAAPGATQEAADRFAELVGVIRSGLGAN